MRRRGDDGLAVRIFSLHGKLSAVPRLLGALRYGAGLSGLLRLARRLHLVSLADARRTGQPRRDARLRQPGGGGAAAWRVSETLGEVETLGRTSHAWFMESMFQYKEDNVSKLPYDHHELCAMVAPRALLVLGNPDYVWLADESGYVSCRAARKVWETFGIADRMGFSIVGGHGHCQLPESQYPEVEAFVDKFLLGKKDANTEVTIAPLYEKVDYERWLFH